MAAGGPADHWFTDITRWNLPAFDEACDQLIREIVTLGGHKALENDAALGKSLGRLWWPPNRAAEGDPRLSNLRETLQTLRDQLHQEALASGWEVD